MPSPDFASHFHEHVTPRIRRAILIQGAMVAADEISWQDAHWEIMHTAWKFGASSLPEHIQEQLREWIGRELINRIDSVDDNLLMFDNIEADIMLMTGRIEADLDALNQAVLARRERSPEPPAHQGAPGSSGS